MLLTLALITCLVVPQEEEGGLPSAGIRARDLERLSDDINAFFAAEDVDDRAAQLELEQELLDEFEKAARRARADEHPLVYVGDWDLALELAKQGGREMRSSIGRGFFLHVFEDEYGTPPVSTVLSVPDTYSDDAHLPPVVVVLKPPLDLSGNELDEAVIERANALYADIIDTHIVLIPLGFAKSDGRRMESTEVDVSWLAPEARQVFFTGLRVLLEQLRFDRSRMVLDGWGAAGGEAVQLASLSPSWYAGVINRGGALPGGDVPVSNLARNPVLWLAPEGGGEPGAAYADVEVEVVPDAGPWEEPSDAAKARVAEWVGERERALAVPEFEFLAAGLEWGSSNWCVIHDLNRRITAVPSDPDYPRLHARVVPDENAIEIDTVNVGELRVYLSDALLDLDEPVTIKVNDEVRFSASVERDLQFLLENRYYMNSGDYGVYTASILVEDIDLNLP